MTIDKVNSQEVNATEKPPLTVQNEIQKDIIKETISTEGSHKQVLQIMASAQPQQQIQQTAKAQIEKGSLDVKV